MLPATSGAIDVLRFVDESVGAAEDAGRRRATVGAWPDSGGIWGMEVAELECASGVPGGAGSFKAAADCSLVFSNPDGVCVRGPWILSADCPQTAKEARSRGKVRAGVELTKVCNQLLSCLYSLGPINIWVH